MSGKWDVPCVQMSTYFKEGDQSIIGYLEKKALWKFIYIGNILADVILVEY